MKLRVATLNVWAMPPPLARHVAWRMRRIGDELASLDLDVVAFQEAWMGPARRRLVREAREAGFEHVWTNPEEPGGGGMVVASRHPIESAEFTQYAMPRAATRVKDLSYFAGRGFVDVRLHTPAGPVRLINTHLHSQSQKLRVAQIVELVARAHRANEPVVAVGDFNFRERHTEYRIWTGLSGFRDAAVESDTRLPTVFPGNPLKERLTSRRIDYVFVRDGAERGMGALRTSRAFDGLLEHEGAPATYSDHAGVLAELELTPRPVTPRWSPDPEAARMARRHLDRARSRTERRNRTDRLIAGTGMLAALGTAAGLRDTRVTRRRLLQRTLQVGALAAIPPAAAGAVFSAVTNPGELRVLEQISAKLDELVGDGLA
jgi:endonuclease/exonuclease/phosphatase family metal-dependent hydrolase